MNEIANIINQLEARKAAIEQALEVLRDFGEKGSIGMVPIFETNS
jgi:hypothetical protein